MPRMHVDVVGYRCWRVLAWSGLITAAFLIASVLQTVDRRHGWSPGGRTGADPTVLGHSGGDGWR